MSSDQHKQRHAPDLYVLSSTVALAAFAAEAWRTLEGIDAACSVCPELDRALSGLVESRRQWSSVTDQGAALSAVLQEVSRQLAAMADEG